MTKRAKDSKCSVCGKVFSAQGLKGHMRFKHPQMDTTEKKQPLSVDIESYKQGFRDGVLEMVKAA